MLIRSAKNPMFMRTCHYCCRGFAVICNCVRTLLLLQMFLCSVISSKWTISGEQKINYLKSLSQKTVARDLKKSPKPPKPIPTHSLKSTDALVLLSKDSPWVSTMKLLNVGRITRIQLESNHYFLRTIAKKSRVFILVIKNIFTLSSDRKKKVLS